MKKQATKKDVKDPQKPKTTTVRDLKAKKDVKGAQGVLGGGPGPHI